MFKKENISWLSYSKQFFIFLFVSLMLGLLLAFFPFKSENTKSAGWYNTDWLYRKQITINYAQVSSTFSNFPVLISLTDSDLAVDAQSNGNDILFTSSNGTTKLDHEIELFSTSTQNLIAWVEIPTLSNTENTVIYMYYGNSGIGSQQNPAGIWDNSYSVVQHASESSGSRLDSTSYNNDGAVNGDGVSQVTGQVGSAVDFAGSDDFLNNSNGSSLSIGNTAITVQGWINPDVSGGLYSRGLILKGAAGTYQPDYGLLWTWNSNGREFYFALGDNRAMSAYQTLDVWHHVVGTYDGSSLKLYVDGALSDTTELSSNISTSENSLYIGSPEAAGTRDFNGAIDEIRISSTTLSAEWISTEYNNQSNPSTFYSVGSEENSNTAPSVAAISPSQTSANFVTVTSTISDSDSDITSLIVEHSTNGTSWTSSTLGSVTVSEGSITTSTGQIASIDTNTDGSVDLTINWNIGKDLLDTDDSTVYLRVIPNDGTIDGTAVASSAFAVDTAAPTTPGNLTVNSITSSAVVLNFGSASVDTNFKEYKIFYKAGASGVTVDDTVYSSSTNSNLSYIDYNNTTSATTTELTANTQYVFNIWAYDDFGNLASATEVTTTTLKLPPSTPGTPSFSNINQTSSTISWTDSDSEENFYLKYGTATGIYNTSTLVSAGTLSTSVTDLATNTTYYVVVVANNNGGFATSSESSFTTLKGTPTAPLILSFSDIASSSINVNWQDNSSGNSQESNFIVKSSTDGLDFTTTASTTIVDVTSAIITSLNPNVHYWFKVEATNNGGTSTSTAADTYTYADLPAIPTLSNVTSSTVDLNVNAGTNSSITEFAIKVTSSTASTYVQANGTLDTSEVWQSDSVWSTITIHGLSVSTTYNFSVKAKNGLADGAFDGGDVESSFSTSASTSTLNLPASIPGTPSFSAITQNSVTVNWEDSDTEESYQIKYGTASGVYTLSTTAGANVLTKDVAGLSASTTYYFVILGINNGGTSTSTEANFTTLKNPPSTPDISSFDTITATSLNINWNDSDTEESYQVEYGMYNGNYVSSTNNINFDVVNTAISNLVPNTQYFFVVEATNNGGTVTSTATSTYTIPNAPTNPVATVVGYNRIDLTWNSNNNSTTTIYEVYNITTSTVLATIASTSYSVTNLLPETLYELRIRAQYAGNTENYSDAIIVSATTGMAPPTASEITSISSITTSGVTLNWNDNSLNETNFTVKYSSTTSDGEYIISSTVDANSQTANVTNLLPNTLYYFIIVANNAGGSASSTVTSTYTIPETPAINTVTTVSTSSLSLTFTTGNNPATTTYAIYNITDSAYIAANGSTTTVSVWQDSATWGTVVMTGLSINSPYSFSVVVKGDDGLQFSTSTASTAKYSKANTPNSPSLSNPTANSVQINLSNIANGNSTNTEYLILRTDGVTEKYLDAGGNESLTSVWQTISVWDNVTAQGLNENTSYTFKVKAKSGAADGSLDAEDFASEYSLGVSSNTSVGSPTNFIVNPGTETADFSVDTFDNSDTPPAGFCFYTGSLDDNCTNGSGWINTNTWQKTSLAHNTAYTYYVVYRDAGSNTSTAVSYSFYTDAYTPGAPTISDITASSLNLSINTNNNTSTIQFAIYKTTTLEYVELDGSEWHTNTEWGIARISSLEPNNQYSFQVKARNNNTPNDETSLGTATSIYTLANQAGTPTISNIAEESMRVTIDENSNNASTNYSIYEENNIKYLQSDYTLNTSPFFQQKTTWGIIDIAGLSVNTQYNFSVIARNSSSVDSATSTAVARYTLQNSPSSVTLSATTSNQIAVTVNGTFYNLGTGLSVIHIDNGADTTADITNSTWTDTGLIPNTLYTYTVTALNGDGVTSTSATSSARTRAAIPVNLVGVADGNSQLTLSWAADGNPNDTYYYIENSADATKNSGWTTSLSYTFTGLTCNTVYSYRVKAKNALDSETDWTESVNASTAGCISFPIRSEPPVIPDLVQEDVKTKKFDVLEETKADKVGSLKSINLGNILFREAKTGGDVINATFVPNSGLSLQIKEENHSIVLKDVKNDRAQFVVFSEPNEFELGAKEEAVVDTNKDLTPDMHVQVNSINKKNKKVRTVITKLASLPVAINNNLSKTDSRAIFVSISKIPNVVQIALSEDPSFKGTSFRSYEPVIPFMLSSGNGIKKVYVKLRTSDGSNAVISDVILLTGQKENIDQEPDKNFDSDSNANCKLVSGKPYKSSKSAAVYYITPECTRRLFVNSSVYFTHFNSWLDLKIVSNEILQSVPLDTLGPMPWGTKDSLPSGSLLKTLGDPKIYYLFNQDKYWFASELVFNTLKYSLSWVIEVSNEVLDKFSLGGEIINTDLHLPYTLIKYPSSAKVYLLSVDSDKSGIIVKRWIVNEEVFLKLKFKFDRIIEIDEDEQYPDGLPMTN